MDGGATVACVTRKSKFTKNFCMRLDLADPRPCPLLPLPSSRDAASVRQAGAIRAERAAVRAPRFSNPHAIVEHLFFE